MALTCFSCSSCGLSFSGLRMGAASLVMMMVMMTLLTSHVVGAVSESSADTLLADRDPPTEHLLLWKVAECKLYKWGTHPECDSACASVRTQKWGDWDWDRVGIGGLGSRERDESTGALIILTTFPYSSHARGWNKVKIVTIKSSMDSEKDN